MFTSLGLAASAQDATVEGMVIGRNGPQMSVKTTDTPRVTVLLSDSTKAEQKGGFLGMGRKDLGITALVPGLSVKVEGSYNPDHQLIAKKVEFSRTSLTTAKAIDAGLNPVNEQLGQQQDQLASNKRDIAASQDLIAKNTQDIDTTKQGLATTTEATTQNTTQIGQTNTRIGTLDQYDTKDSMTINFANGQAIVKKQDKDALTDFVKAAANTPGFMIEVQGYASTVGSAALNQRLSAERADAVLAIIQQSGAVPMTRILAPAAMGTSNQVDDGHTRKAQAQNRRVVVTIVVNKGITGSTGS
ncbi:MAG TPA: OmpA family protein [Acidobacteriaceae bacterium]|nr:OmpA family protein [Acidobacteriaceae bacterium]